MSESNTLVENSDYNPSTYEKISESEVEFDLFSIVFSILGFFFGAFLLDIANLPIYMIVVISPIYIILLVSFWYLVIDFIKDISILGSGI